MSSLALAKEYSQGWIDKYLEILDSYIREESELSLYRVSLLGKEIIELGISPEEVVEAHLTTFRRIMENANYSEWIPYFYKSFNLLIEIMTVFGLTYKEHMQLRDELKKAFAAQVAYKRLKFYVDEMEFVTSRLASLNEELDRRVMELSSLQKISKAINSVLDLDQLLKCVTQSIRDIVDYDTCSIMMLDEHGNLRLKEVSMKEDMIFSDLHMHIHSKAAEHAIALGEVYSLMNQKELNIINNDEVCINSLLSAPMIIENEPIGAITLDSRKTNLYSDEHIKLLSIAASHAAAALKNSITFEEIKKISVTDGLTGAYNHQYFYERLKTEIDWARHYDLPLSILMIDIDDFKNFNDTYGHPSGDKALKTIANIISKSIRQEDILARYGGEEFAVILISVDSSVAKRVAERIKSDIENYKIVESNKPQSLSVSIGGASFPGDARDVKGLVELADRALYESKKSGKNRVTFGCIGQSI